jgi:DNA-binding NarL/FixJ family response regulator
VNVRVLLVDANDDSRAGLAQRLRRTRGIELVGEARDAAEAAQVVAQSEPDVVLVDLHGWDGQSAELCRGLRNLVSVPLAVLASFMTPEHWEQLRRAGATDFLLKHVDTKGLGRALAELGTRPRRHSLAGEPPEESEA